MLTDSGNPRLNATEANVRLYGPDLLPVGAEVPDRVVTNPPNAQPPVWNTTAPFQRKIENHGVYTYIFAAQDAHMASYKGHLFSPGAAKWADGFWHHLYRDGMTVAEAAKWAALEAPFGSNVRNYRIVPEGGGNFTIHPARYNSGQ